MSDESPQRGMIPEENPMEAESGVREWHPPQESATAEMTMPDRLPFPADALPDAAQRMVDEVVRVTFADPNLVCAQVIPSMAAALGKGAVANSGDRLVFGNVFVLGIAGSGTGKSESMRILRRPFDKINAELAEHWERTVRSEAETRMRGIELQMNAIEKRSKNTGYSNADAQRVAQLSVEKRQLEIQLIPPRLLFEDATQEAMVDACASFDQSIFACSSDAGKAISNLHGRYAKSGGSLFREDTFLLKAFSNEQIVVNRIKGSTILEEPCLSLLWLVQPGKVASLYGDESLCDGGLIPRMMPCLASVGLPLKTIQEPVSDAVSQGWQTLINGLYGLRKTGGSLFSRERTVFQINRDAMELLIGWDNGNRKKTQDGVFADISAFVSRWGEWALRTVVNLLSAEYIKDSSSNAVTIRMMRKAIMIAEWFANEQLRVLHEGRVAARRGQTSKRMERAGRLEELLIASGGEKSLSELANRNSFSADEVGLLVREHPNRFGIETRVSATKPARVCVLKSKRPL